MRTDFPDDSSVHRTFRRWIERRVLDRLWAVLVQACEDVRKCYNQCTINMKGGGLKVAKEPKRIRIGSASDLHSLLEEAGREGSVLLEYDGVTYRIIALAEEEEDIAPEDLLKGYDPEKVKEPLRKSAGALVGVDREQLLRDIHEEREQDSHGRPW